MNGMQDKLLWIEGRYDEITQLMTQPDFLVCNRGVIINMSKVLRFEGDCIEMLDGTHLPVRQKDKNSLLAQFTQYQFRGMQREF